MLEARPLGLDATRARRGRQARELLILTATSGRLRYFFQSLAFVHALSVIGTLVHVSFGKLFHVFQRPASVGIVFYRAAGEQGESARCPVTGEGFAPALQVKDLNGVLTETGLDYRPAGCDGPRWNELSPRGRRVLLGQAHRAARQGRFN